MNLEYTKKLQKLTSENRKIFLNVANKIKFNYAKSETAADIVIEDMLDHLLEAQSNGMHAQQFFGQNYQEYAEEIIEELPDTKPIDKLWHFAFIVCLTLSSSLLPFSIIEMIRYLVTGKHIMLHSISFTLNTALFIILLIILISFTLNSMKNNAFREKKSMFIFIVIFSLMVSIPLVLYTVLPIGPKFYLDYRFAIPSELLLLILTIWIYRNKVSPS
ncbi:DUF1129 family protein [Macrococcus lamae]|nr:DUF1129 family protein [Macrococcus lamae]